MRVNEGERRVNKVMSKNKGKTTTLPFVPFFHPIPRAPQKMPLLRVCSCVRGGVEVNKGNEVVGRPASGRERLPSRLWQRVLAVRGLAESIRRPGSGRECWASGVWQRVSGVRALAESVGRPGSGREYQASGLWQRVSGVRGLAESIRRWESRRVSQAAKLQRLATRL
jgi:hypothetical protein